jgi:hypothetical protein
MADTTDFRDGESDPPLPRLLRAGYMQLTASTVKA